MEITAQKYLTMSNQNRKHCYISDSGQLIFDKTYNVYFKRQVDKKVVKFLIQNNYSKSALQVIKLKYSNTFFC